MVFNRVDQDAGFLTHLARDGVLQGLSGLHESCDGGIASRRPGRLAPQQGPFAVADQHDDGRIDARKLLASTGRIAANQHMAALRGQGLFPAGAAEPVPPPPGHHGARIAQYPGLVGGQHGGNLAQILESRAGRYLRGLDRFDLVGEITDFAELSQQDQVSAVQALRGHLG
jgi:hypothetical protein